MSNYEFKAQLPIEEVMHLIKMFREGTLLENKGDALQCAGAVLGETGAYLNTFEEGLFGMNKPNLPNNLKDCAYEIELLVGSENYTTNPLLELLIAQLVKLLLEYLL